MGTKAEAPALVRSSALVAIMFDVMGWPLRMATTVDCSSTSPTW